MSLVHWKSVEEVGEVEWGRGGAVTLPPRLLQPLTSAFPSLLVCVFQRGDVAGPVVSASEFKSKDPGFDPLVAGAG